MSVEWRAMSNVHGHFGLHTTYFFFFFFIGFSNQYMLPIFTHLLMKITTEKNNRRIKKNSEWKRNWKVQNTNYYLTFDKLALAHKMCISSSSWLGAGIHFSSFLIIHLWFSITLYALGMFVGCSVVLWRFVTINYPNKMICVQ